jgi:hypothetical protein
MLAAYFDESGNIGTDRMSVLSGLAATEEAWAALSDAWRLHLSSHSIQYLHMSEANKRDAKSQFRGWSKNKVDRFLDGCAAIILGHVSFGICVAVENVPFKNAMATGKSYGIYLFSDLYLFSYAQAVLAWYAVKLKTPVNDDMRFFFDSNSTPALETKAMYGIIVNALPPQFRDIMLQYPPIMDDDKTTPPLQTADMLAYYQRRYLNGYGESDILKAFMSKFQIIPCIYGAGRIREEIDASVAIMQADGYTPDTPKPRVREVLEHIEARQAGRAEDGSVTNRLTGRCDDDPTF